MKLTIKHFTFLVFIWMILGTTTPVAAQKIKITRADELPCRTNDLTGNVKDIYKNDVLLTNLADQIYSNGLSDLSTYDIEDKATLSSYYAVLGIIDFQKGHYDEVLRKLKLLKNLEDKEEELPTFGLNRKEKVCC